MDLLQMARRKKPKGKCGCHMEKIYEMNGQKGCFENGYKIQPIVKEAGYKLVIEDKGQKRTGQLVYTKDEWVDGIWKLYSQIYGKNKN